MPDTLSVHLSRTELHAIESPSSFETTESFDVEFRNHGRSSRVHCTVDDALAGIVEIPETNRMIDSDGALRMTFDVKPVDRPVAGELEIVTGYGAASATVTLTVTPPEERSSVESFDDAYGSDAEAEGIGGISLDRDDRLVLGLAVGAVLLALIVAVLVSDPVVMLGTVAVLAAIVVAGFLLWQE
ncbi:MAG TPA: hypothetical protein VJ898_06130 [Natrialbaceae archaeon]|nr:hypothetical protein [Natrialbaceae archaeon]